MINMKVEAPLGTIKPSVLDVDVDEDQLPHMEARILPNDELHIHVKLAHVKYGREGSASHCVLARAIQDRAEVREVRVKPNTKNGKYGTSPLVRMGFKWEAHVETSDGLFVYKLPRRIGRAAVKFDNNGDWTGPTEINLGKSDRFIPAD